MKQSRIEDDLMPEELLEAARSMKWEYLLERLEAAESENHFLCRLPDGSNIIHLAVECCETDLNGEYFNCSNDEESYSSSLEEFIVEVPKKFPILYCQTDDYGQTPLNIAMRRNILKPGGRAFQTLVDHLTHFKNYPIPPWEARDDDGDTLLHLAISFQRYELAEKLIELDSKLVGKINNKNETPLHILCFFGERTESRELKERDMVDLLVEKGATTVNSYDAEGLTPFLRAVEAGSFKIATRILHQRPESIAVRESQYNRNVFHLMDLDPDSTRHREFSNKLLDHHKAVNSLRCQDCNGNTPLHHAIEQHRFGTAQILMEYIGMNRNEYLIRNNDGKTALNVLAKADEVPRWFQDFLKSGMFDQPFKLREAGIGIFGVRDSDIKEYMGTIGVVAALLTTITFTAAFTIPGGYDQNIGTPIMATKVAFQVFMFADVIGMCSSMMVLFCLLWFLSSGRVEDDASVLVDISIGLLQLSFCATLIAFMTGVYVTTFPDVHWLAIFTCVLCSIVLLSMRKRYILDYLVPVLVYIVYFTENAMSKIAKLPDYTADQCLAIWRLHQSNMKILAILSLFHHAFYLQAIGQIFLILY